MAEKIALYVRVSTVDQSLESQLVELRAYCGRIGWQPTIYEDTASGGRGATRPNLERLLADVRAGRVNVVMVTKLDRLGRSLSHLALVLEEFRARGCGLIAISQGIDTRASNPLGSLMLGILGAVSEFELSLIRERTRAGIVSARAAGKRFGRPPLATEIRERITAAAARMGPKVRAISRELSLPVSTVSRVLKPIRPAPEPS